MARSSTQEGAWWRATLARSIMLAAVTGGLGYVLGGKPVIAGKSATDQGPLVETRRGRGAHRPSEIPLRGWRDIAIRTLREFNSDHVTIIAGGVTFSVLLAIFPALGAFVALYGLVADVNQIPQQLHELRAVLPSDAVNFLGGEMMRLAKARHQGLSLALGSGLVLSFWSANGAMKATFVGMNVAYAEKETRGFVRLYMTTLAFTLGLILFLVVALAALSLSGVVEHFLGSTVGTLVKIARWPVLVLGFAGGASMLYRYGPSRPKARWRWISWGSAVATVVWLLASLLFSLYASNFAHYDRTYGSLGTVIALMVWIWISATILLFGAELNSEVEHQAAVDATNK